MKKTLKLLMILFVTVMIGSSATMVKAQNPALDFITYGPSGTFTLDPIAQSLEGKGIIIDVVKGIDTLLNDGKVLTLTNTVMDFKAHVVPNLAQDYIKIYSPTETFLDGQVVQAFWTSATRFRVVYGDIQDVKPESSVMEYFGINFPPYTVEPWIGFMNLTFDYEGLKFLNGSVYNEYNGPGTPIPGSVLLLGTGIIALVGIGMRKRSA